MRTFYSLVIKIALLALLVTPLYSRGSFEESNLPEVTEIVLWHSSSGLAGEAMSQLTEQFNATIGKEHSIVVREIYQGKAEDVSTKIRAILQADRKKDLPDIAQLDATGIMDVRESKHLVTTSTLMERDPLYDSSQLESAALHSMAYLGQIIGMPFNNSTILLYYNKDAFIEAGLDPELPPRTLSDLATYSSALVKKSSDGKRVLRYGYGGVPTTYELVSWIGQQHGLSYMTDFSNGHDGDSTRVVFDSDGTLATFLEAWKKVYEGGGLQNLTTNVNQEFVAQKIAMMAASTSALSTLINAIGDRFELGVGYLPQVNEEATGGVNIGGGALFVFDNGNDAEKQSSWEFLKFLVSPESQLLWHKATGYFPVNRGTYELPQFKEHIEANPLFQTAINQLHESNPRLQSVWWPNSYQAYYEVQNSILEMLERGQGVQETVEKLSSVLNRYLEEYNRSKR